MRTLLKGGSVVSGRGVRRADVLIDGEKIAQVGRGLSAGGGNVMDVTGMLLFPGFIDAHTHFDLDVCNTTTADDFTSGSRAAIRGGTTTVIDFACPNKGETLQYGLDLWHRKADGRAFCDYGFHMNRRIYRRNHFCFSFVLLKKRADGTPDETTLKVFLKPEDTVFTISSRVQELIDRNSESAHSNSTDKFANLAFAVPALPRFVFWLIYHLDLHGLLPRRIIDLSPFHTSLFVTNLASINTSCIYHHCYEFGTTGVFVCMWDS